MNEFIELANEEADGALASDWEDLENKRLELQTTYREIQMNLANCNVRLRLKKLTQIAQEEVASIRGDLAKDWVNVEARSVDNAHMAIDLTRARTQATEEQA